MATSTPPPLARPVRRRLGDARRGVRRAVLARRRPLAALLSFVAVAAGLHAARPPAPSTVAVSVAARDLAAGTVLTRADLTTVRLAPDLVPDGTVHDPVAGVLAGPVRRGEPVTDLRLVGPQLAAGHPELTAMPVRLPDAGMVGLLHLGDRIDVVAADPRGGTARTVADDALVLALPDDAEDAGDPGDPGGTTASGTGAAGLEGRLVVLGVTETDVTPLAAAAVGDFLSYSFAG